MELKLGKNKIIKISPWKTKTKKDFLNIIRKKEKNISEDDIMDVLIKPYIESNDIYFSDDELQWILINLRNISVDNNIKFLIECGNCKKDIIIECKLLDLCEYTENQYPIIKNNQTWKDINNLEEYKSSIQSYPDEFPKNIEMLLHLEAIGDKRFNSIKERIEYFENLDLESGNNLVKEYEDIKSNIKLFYKTKCSHCDYKSKYTFDEIPDFFEPLLPKEL
jgi:hypothetical protein